MTRIDRSTAEGLIAAKLSPRRRDHAHRVASEAVVLAERFGAPVEKAELAGLLHDYCRELSDEETLAAAVRYAIPVGPVEARRPKKILHGPVAAAELAELGLDEDVAAAIRLHTVGAAGMTTLEKCVYLADYVEPGRRLPRGGGGARAGDDVARSRSRCRGSPEPAGHHRPRPRGGPRRTRVVQRDPCRGVRDTAATGCAAGVARGSSARRRGSSTSWRRQSPSRPCSAPGT